MKRMFQLSVTFAALAASCVAYASPIYCGAGRLECNRIYAECIASGDLVPNCEQLRDACYVDFCG